MNIIYFWYGENGNKEPGCRSDVLSDDGLDLLACLFTDHGGQKYESSLAWLDEGLSRVNQVELGTLKVSDWSRDSWGVELKNGMARIYSLYDEDCSIAIALDDFKKALLGWEKFIQAG
ncbi:hypothetical protein [Pseudomonas oryzihabitans]|uniref:CdiI n=1 Tax=Pseudomonas oryzihabitans TaxID=47885 RepID=A0AAJ2EWH1_9PSED|nr:hypothetical protein [Pseudomonas psychrotolerans]MDR6234569.1 hypothetical protein [Pseudomonas psychrotolerans]MDR6356283.1 hypothetical protein [Pseudomonas psychrotolerans]